MSTLLKVNLNKFKFFEHTTLLGRKFQYRTDLAKKQLCHSVTFEENKVMIVPELHLRPYGFVRNLKYRLNLKSDKPLIILYNKIKSIIIRLCCSVFKPILYSLS